VPARGEHSNLSPTFINNGCEKFYDVLAQDSLEKMEAELEVSKPFVDIRSLDEKDPQLFMEKSFHRMWHTMQPLTK